MSNEESNRLIAEFMGWGDAEHSTISPDVTTNYENKYKRFDSPDGKHSLSYYWDDFAAELKYDIDWSWLMPVVGKIALMLDTMESSPAKSSALIEGIRLARNVARMPLCSTIGEVLERVIQFITWYNTNPIKS